MSTIVQDDYLVCREYKEQINNKSTTHPGFITFKHENGNHYFAWVNGDEIVMRSEAYPDADKMERGINAILKNCDLMERYSVIEEHGAHMLLLWGGGDHQKHTGNRNEHSEIGRSCPHKTREELNALLQFKGNDFANKVVPITNASSSTTATTVAAVAAASTVAATSFASANVKETATAASTSFADTTVAATGSSMGWLKWLLPILIGAGAYFLWKNYNSKDTAQSTVEGVIKSDTITTINDAVPVTKVTVDTVTGVVNYDLGASSDVDLGGGVILTGVAKDGFENTLVNFIKTGKIDTVNKKANWFNLHDVQFISGKTEYATPKALAQIKNVGAILKAYPNVVLKLGGYTDVSGDAAKNKDLSDRRAKQVMKDLVANGAAVNQIKEALGYGSEFAEAKAGDKEGMARDRKTAAKVAAM
jgi:outer membrane protein OmpA-like peptidoglycan-associated protein